MKQFKRVLVIMGLILSSIILISCVSEGISELDNVKETLIYETILHQGDTKDKVTKDLNLFTKDGNVTITWSSSNTNVITNTGVVNRTDSNVTVTLTATLDLNGDKTSKEFELVVLALDIETTTYTVTFNTDGGTNVESQTVNSDSKAIKPTNPTKAGFTFLGWFLGDVEFNFDTAITANTTLVAKWEENEGTVPVEKTTVVAKYPEGETTRFSSNDTDNNASLIGLDPNLFEVLGSIIVMPTYSNPIGLNKDGSIRLYSNRDNGEGNLLKVSVAEGLEIHELKFVFGEHSSPATDAELVLGEEKEALTGNQIVNTTLERKGLNINTFSIQNKYQDTSGSNQIWILSIEITYSGVEQTPTEPVTEYTVTFDTDGGNNIDSQTITEGSKVNEPADPVKQGYTFIGWFVGEDEFNFDTAISENTTLTAKWEVEEVEEPGETDEDTTTLTINYTGEQIGVKIDSGDITDSLTIGSQGEASVSVEFVQGTGNNNIFNNTAGEIRLYVDGELIIKVSDGFEIVSVDFTTTRNNGVLVNDLEFSDNDVNVLFDTPVSEVSIKANGNQVRIDTITITYKAK